MKNFKLKSRSAFETLVDEETVLMNELQMWDEKFAQYALEKSDNREVNL